jgi:hypothetical protein
MGFKGTDKEITRRKGESRYKGEFMKTADSTVGFIKNALAVIVLLIFVLIIIGGC